jgi:hypothetical protein
MDQDTNLRGGEVIQVVEHMPHKCKASSTTKKKKKDTNLKAKQWVSLYPD